MKMLAVSQKDIEQAYKEMDKIMATTLYALGYESAVKIFMNAYKRYA